MKRTKKVLASLAIASMAISSVPFNAFAAGTIPTRLAGMTAEQTAVAIADQTGYTGTAILASSASYGASDALTAGPLAAYLKAPILLQGPENALNSDTKEELAKLNVKKVYVTSGAAVIKQAVLNELKGMGIEVESLGGNDRFDTSVNIAKKLVELGAPVKKVAVAYGWLNQDALSIASVASAANQPIILTEKAGLSANAKAFLKANPAITAADVIGGTGVIDASVLAELPNATRHFGNTAYDTNNQVIKDFAGSLKFDNIFLANGVTGIDALSGAPLAAMTQSPIVLTDGKSVPAAATFTYSKSVATTVVTALGGAAVVPEDIRAGVAAGKTQTDSQDLKVVSVAPLDLYNRYIEITFNKPVNALEPADIAVIQQDTRDKSGILNVTMASDNMSCTVEFFHTEDDEEVLSFQQNYEITVKANGTTLPMYLYNRVWTDKVRITEIDTVDREFEAVSDRDGSKWHIKVADDYDFDFVGAWGELTQIYFDENNYLVNHRILSNTAKYDAIEILEHADEELRLVSEDKEYDISKETFKQSKDVKFKVYVDGEEFDLEDKEEATMAGLTKDGVNLDEDRKFNFAKIGFDGSGDIEFVSFYNMNQFVIVDEVIEDEVVGYEGEGTGGSFDAQDATIIKDNKQIELSDLKQGDVMFFYEDTDGTKDFAEVYNKTVSGEIEEVYDDSIVLDGETYDFVYDSAQVEDYEFDYTSAVYLDENSKTKKVEEDEAEELQAAGDVTLYSDRGENLVYIGGDLAEVEGNNRVVLLTKDLESDDSFGDNLVQLETIDKDGDEEVYQLDLEDLDQITLNDVEYDVEDDDTADNEWDDDEYSATINGNNIELKLRGQGNPVATIPLALEGEMVKLRLTDDGDLDEIEFFTEPDTNEGRMYLNTTSENPNGNEPKNYDSALESGKSYFKNEDTSKKLNSGTVVFDASDDNVGFDPDDIDVTTWGEYQGEDISKARAIYDEDDEVMAIVILDNTSSDTETKEAVIIRRDVDDGEVVKLEAWVDGEKKTYEVDDVNVNIDKGDAVVLEFDEDNDEVIQEIYPKHKRISYNWKIKEVGGKKQIDMGEREVTFVKGTQEVTYKLAPNGLVLDGKNDDDITKETMSELRDLAADEYITVVLDENTGKFAKFFMIEDELQDEGTAAVSLSDYNEALAEVDEEDYTAESWAIYEAIVNANKVTTANTQAQIDAATEAITDAQEDLVEVDDEEELLTESDVATKEGFAGVTFGVKVDFPDGVTSVKVTSVDGQAQTVQLIDGSYKSVAGTYNAGDNEIVLEVVKDGVTDSVTITK